ncbi:hypothetical protein SBDP1_10033 [Syntrophobacter sp. SbD1]|nr:hypothetical protein SBDP1_10033 [Syntrophobacter sp. SbD1]
MRTATGEKGYSNSRQGSTRSEKVRPQVTFSVAHLSRFGSFRLFLSTSPKKVLRFLLSVEYFRRAFSLGFLLRPLGVRLKSKHNEETVKESTKASLRKHLDLVLHYLGWRLLVGHKDDIPWIAKLAWKLGDSSTRNAHKINLREFGFANVSWVRRCPPAIFANMGLL